MIREEGRWGQRVAPRSCPDSSPFCTSSPSFPYNRPTCAPAGVPCGLSTLCPGKTTIVNLGGPKTGNQALFNVITAGGTYPLGRVRAISNSSYLCAVHLPDGGVSLRLVRDIDLRRDPSPNLFIITDYGAFPDVATAFKRVCGGCPNE